MTLSEHTRQLLAEHGFTPKKKLGQNFIIDRSSVDRIVSAGAISKTDVVLEIGTGLGTLTKALAEAAGHAISVEYDKVLFEIAKEELKGFGNIDLIREDFLKLDLKKTLKKLGSYKVIANVPYYITAPIITKLTEATPRPELAVLTVQKEVGERLVAKPGTKDYGTLSIYVQYYFDVSIDSYIPKSAFLPHPAVSSAIVVMKPRSGPPVKVNDEKKFFAVVHAAFEHRRKTLRKALLISSKIKLSKEDVDLALRISGIDGERRGETLSIEEFAQLSNNLG